MPDNIWRKAPSGKLTLASLLQLRKPNNVDIIADDFFILSEPPLPVGGEIKHWTGSAWVLKPVKYWSGSAWVTKPIKRWTGSAWL